MPTKKKKGAKKQVAGNPSGKIKGSNGQQSQTGQAWERGESIKTAAHVWEEKPEKTE